LYIGNPAADEDFFDGQVRQGERIREFIARIVPGFQPRNVFDVGCGAGGSLVPFARDGVHTAGCDLGERYLEYGRARGLNLEHGDLSELRPHGPADCVLLSHVFEHVADPESLLRTLRCVTAEQTLVYVEVPGALNIHGFYGSVRRSMHIAHVYHYFLDSLAKVFAKHGLRLLNGSEELRALFVREDDPLDFDSPTDPQAMLRYLKWVRLRAIFERALGLVGGHRVVTSPSRRLRWPPHGAS
jgi:SAM-dependent methyltransferase